MNTNINIIKHHKYYFFIFMLSISTHQQRFKLWLTKYVWKHMIANI